MPLAKESSSVYALYTRLTCTRALESSGGVTIEPKLFDPEGWYDHRIIILSVVTSTTSNLAYFPEILTQYVLPITGDIDPFTYPVTGAVVTLYMEIAPISNRLPEMFKF